MGHLFSERYEELLQDESNWFGGDDGGSVPYSAKVLIARVMEDFREPINLQPSRYDNYTVDTDALDLAIRELNESVDYRVVDLDMMRMGSGLDGGPTPLTSSANSKDRIPVPKPFIWVFTSS